MKYTCRFISVVLVLLLSSTAHTHSISEDTSLQKSKSQNHPTVGFINEGQNLYMPSSPINDKNLEKSYQKEEAYSNSTVKLENRLRLESDGFFSTLFLHKRNSGDAIFDPSENHECEDVKEFKDKCSFVKQYCVEEHLGYINYLQIYYCSKSWVASVVVIVLMGFWLASLFMAIGIAASDYLCPNLNTVSKMLGLSESLAGVTFLAFGNGSPDVFSTYAAMKIGSGSLAIGELIGAASFITAVVAGSMAIIRPFKVAKRSFVRDASFFTVAVCFSMYVLSDGILRRWECFAMLALYLIYVIFVVGWHYYQTTKRRRYLVETRARDFYTEAGFETQIEQDEEIRDDEGSILTQGLDMTGLNSPVEDDRSRRNSSLFPRLLSNGSTPRGSTVGLPISSTSLEDQLEEEQEEAYNELTKGMRLRNAVKKSTVIGHPVTSSDYVNASIAAIAKPMSFHSEPSANATSNTLNYGNNLSPTVNEFGGAQLHTPITPIRPSLFGALEFRNVLQQLEDSRSSSGHMIPLHRRFNDYGMGNERPGYAASAHNMYVSEYQHVNNVLPSSSSDVALHLPESSTVSAGFSSDNTNDSKSSKSLPIFNVGSSNQNKSHERKDSNSKFKDLPKLQIPQLIVTNSQSGIFEEDHDDSSNQIGEPRSPLNRTGSDLSTVSTVTSPLSPHPNLNLLHSNMEGLEDDSVTGGHDLNETISSTSSHNDVTIGANALPKTRSVFSKIASKFSSHIPNAYIPIFSTLFPSLIGITEKTFVGVITSIATAPAIFLLTITVPVIDADTITKEEPKPNVEVQQGYSDSPSIFEPYHDEENYQDTNHNDISMLLPQKDKLYIPINRWLLIVEAIFGPLFVMFSNIEDGTSPDENETVKVDEIGSTTVKMLTALFYSVVCSLIFLGMIKFFLPSSKRAPLYVQFVSLIGFVISISWISIVANEVVGILKAVGIMFHISDAILGLTVFAVGNSLGDFVANTTVARMGFPMMALSACFGGPMLNILVGIGMSGLLVIPSSTSGKAPGVLNTLTTGADYQIHISHGLIISTVTLLVTLIFLLISIPLNKWRMNRFVGIVTVSFWVISTIINVILEIFVFK